MHKEIRYIEWYRDFLMTIWRQHFFGVAHGARIRTPSPPPLLPHVDSLPDVLSATPADQWPGVEGKSCSVIGWMSTWGALDRSTPKNLYTLEGTLEARLSPAG